MWKAKWYLDGNFKKLRKSISFLILLFGKWFSKNNVGISLLFGLRKWHFWRQKILSSNLANIWKSTQSKAHFDFVENHPSESMQQGSREEKKTQVEWRQHSARTCSPRKKNVNAKKVFQPMAKHFQPALIVRNYVILGRRMSGLGPRIQHY